MSPTGLHYFPVTWPYLLLLALFYALVIATITRFASEGMGISDRAVLVILLLSLAGSYVNIPIATLPEREISTAAVVSFYGIPWVVPVIREWPATVVAINLGGAVIPILVSLYLLFKWRLYLLSVVGVAAVAVLTHWLANPVRGVGIALPVFVPPVITAIVALGLSRKHAGPLAYISGSLGTLIGADLLNLDKIRGLGAPIASIGGAGSFDGIFITGLLAVTYASVVRYRQRSR